MFAWLVEIILFELIGLFIFYILPLEFIRNDLRVLFNSLYVRHIPEHTISLTKIYDPDSTFEHIRLSAAADAEIFINSPTFFASLGLMQTLKLDAAHMIVQKAGIDLQSVPNQVVTADKALACFGFGMRDVSEEATAQDDKQEAESKPF